MVIEEIVFLLGESFTPGGSKRYNTDSIWRYLVATIAANDQNKLSAFRSNPDSNTRRQLIILLHKTATRVPAFEPTLQQLMNRMLQSAQTNAATPDTKMMPETTIMPETIESVPDIPQPSPRRRRTVRGGGTPKKAALVKKAAPPAGGSGPKKGPRKGAPMARKPAKKTAPKKAAKKAAPIRGGREEAVHKSTKQPVKKGECYTRVSCDNQLVLNKSAKVKVDLSRDELKQLKNKLSAVVAGEVDPGIPLTVNIYAITNVRVKGSFTQQTTVPLPGELLSLEFFIVPTALGKIKFGIEVWQDQAPVCSVELTPVCVEVKTNTRQAKAVVATPEVEPFPEPVIQLRIRERDLGKYSFYDYELNSKLPELNGTYTSPPIQLDRPVYVSQLYEEIENLWQTVSDDVKQFAHELRNFGGHLYDKLFPEDLQKILFKYAEKIDSIQVISSEPFIPWELVLIKNPNDKKPALETHKFLGELGLIRWLQKWEPVTRLRIRDNQARYVIPEYLDTDYELPAGKKERDFLVKEFSATEVQAKPLTIDKLLKKPGSFDLLHFCCHGEGETNKITYAKLRMLETLSGTAFKPAFLTQLSVEGCGSISKNKDHRPIVVLNACRVGKSGNALSGYGGFANAFLKAGAGAFVGSNWSIEDEPAEKFITTFYKQLKKGKTLAKAVTAARKIARKGKDATWISYVIYGHPFAKLEP